MPCVANRAFSIPAAPSSNWRSISRGVACSTVTRIPRRTSPAAASNPSSPPPITTASPPVAAWAIIRCTSSNGPVQQDARPVRTGEWQPHRLRTGGQEPDGRRR